MADSDEGEIDFNLEGMGFTVLDECEEEEGFDLGSEDEQCNIVVLDELEETSGVDNTTDKTEKTTQLKPSQPGEKKDSNREKRSLSKGSDRSQHRSARARDSRGQTHTYRSRDSRRSYSPKRHSSRHSSSKDHHRSSHGDRKERTHTSRRSHERSQPRHGSTHSGSKSRSGHRPRDLKKVQHDQKKSDSDDEEDMKITVFEFPEDNDPKKLDTTELVSVDLYEADRGEGNSSPKKQTPDKLLSKESVSVQKPVVSKDEAYKEKVSIAVSEKPAAELLMEETQSSDCKQQQPATSKKVELILKKLPKSVEKELSEKGHVVDKERNAANIAEKDTTESSEALSKETPSEKDKDDAAEETVMSQTQDAEEEHDKPPDSPEVVCWEEKPEVIEVSDDDIEEFYMQADAETELVTEVKKEDLISETEQNVDVDGKSTNLDKETVETTTENESQDTAGGEVDTQIELSTSRVELQTSNSEETSLAIEVQKPPSVEQTTKSTDEAKNDEETVVCISENDVNVVHLKAEQNKLIRKDILNDDIPDAVVLTSSREDEIIQPKDARNQESYEEVKKMIKNEERVVGIENFNEKVMSEKKDSKISHVEWCEVINSDEEDDYGDIEITAVDEVDVSVGNDTIHASSTTDLVAVDVEQEGEEDDMQINADDMLEVQMKTNTNTAEEKSLPKDIVDKEELDLVELDNLQEEEQEEEIIDIDEDCGEIDEDAFKAMLESEGLVDVDEIQDEEKSDMEADNDGEGFDVGTDDEIERKEEELSEDVVITGVEEQASPRKETSEIKVTKSMPAESLKKTKVDSHEQIQETDTGKVDTDLYSVEEVSSSDDELLVHHEAFSDDEKPLAVEEVSFEYGDDEELVDIDTLEDAGIDHKLRAKAERIKLKRQFKDWELPDFSQEHTDAFLSSMKVPVKLSKFRLAELLSESGLKLLSQVGTFSAQIYKGDGLMYGDLTVRDFNPEVMINTFAGFLQKTKNADLDASQIFKFLTENRIMEYGRTRLKKRKLVDQRAHGVVVKGMIMIYDLPTNVTDIALKRIFPGCERIIMPKDYRGENTSLALVIYDTQSQVKQILKSKFQIRKRYIVHYDEICTMTSKEKWEEHFEKPGSKSEIEQNDGNKGKNKSENKEIALEEDPLEAQLMKDVQLQLKLLKEQSEKQEELSKGHEEQSKQQAGNASRTISVMSSGMTVTISGEDKNAEKEQLMPPPADPSTKGVPGFKITKTTTKRRSMEDYEKMRSPLSNLEQTQVSKGRGRSRQVNTRDGKEAQRGRGSNDDKRKEIQKGKEVQSGREGSRDSGKGKLDTDRILRSDERSDRITRSSDRKTRSSDRNTSVGNEREKSSERSRKSKESSERKSKWDDKEKDNVMLRNKGDSENPGAGRQILVEMPGSGGQIMEIGATPELVVQSVTCVPFDALDKMPIPELPEGMSIPEGGLIVEREISFTNQPSEAAGDIFSTNQFKDDFRKPRVAVQSVQTPIMSSSVALQGPPGIRPPPQPGVAMLPGQHVLQSGASVLVPPPPSSIPIQGLSNVQPPPVSSIPMAPFGVSAPGNLPVQNPLVPIPQQVLQQQMINQPGQQMFGTNSPSVAAGVHTSLVSGQPVVMATQPAGQIPQAGQNIQVPKPNLSSSVSKVQTLQTAGRPQHTKAPASTRVLVPIAKQSSITTAPNSAAQVRPKVQPTVTVQGHKQVNVLVTQSMPNIRAPRAPAQVSQQQTVQPVLQARQPLQKQQATLHEQQQRLRQPLQAQQQPVQTLQQQSRQPLQQVRQPLQQQQQQARQPLQQQARQPLQQQARQPLQQQLRQPLQQQLRQPLQLQQPRLSMEQQEHLMQKIMPIPTSHAQIPSSSVQTSTTSAIALQSSQLKNIKKAIIEQKKKLKETIKEQQKSGLHAKPDFQSQPVKYVAPVCQSTAPSTSTFVTSQPSQSTQSIQSVPGNKNLLSVPIQNMPSVGQPIEVIQNKDLVRQKIDAAKWSKEFKDWEEKAKAEKERIQREKEAKEKILKEKAEKDRIQREKELKEMEEREKKRREREERAKREEKLRQEKERKERIEREKKEKIERERKMIERQERERRNKEELIRAEKEREERRRKMEDSKRKKESNITNTSGMSPQTLHFLQQQRKRKASGDDRNRRSRSPCSGSDLSSITSSSGSDSDSMRDLEDSEKTLRKSRKMRMMIEKMDYAEEKRRLRREREKLAKQEERLRKLVEASALAGGQDDSEENSLISLLTTALEAAKKKVASASKTKNSAAAQNKNVKASDQSDHDSADMSMSEEEKMKATGDMVIDYGHRSILRNTDASNRAFQNQNASSTAVTPSSYTESKANQPQVTDYTNRPATTIAREWNKRASSSMYDRGQPSGSVTRSQWETQPGYSTQQNFPAKSGMAQLASSSADSDPLTALLKSSLNTVQEHISEMRNPQKIPTAAELQDILNKVKEVAGNVSVPSHGGGQTMMSIPGRGLTHPLEQRIGTAPGGSFLMGVEASTVQKPEVIEYGHSRPEWEKYRANPMKTDLSDRFGLDYYMGNVFEKEGAMRIQPKQRIGDPGEEIHWGYTNFDYNLTDKDRHKIPQEIPRSYRNPNKPKVIPCLLDIDVTKKGIDYTQWSVTEESMQTKTAQKRPGAQNNDGAMGAKKGKLDHQGKGQPSKAFQRQPSEKISKQQQRNTEIQKVNSVGEFLKNLGSGNDEQSVDYSAEDTSSRAERKSLVSKYSLVPGHNNEPLQFEDKIESSRTVVRNEFSLMRNKPNQTSQGSENQGQLGNKDISGVSQRMHKSYQSWDTLPKAQGQGQQGTNTKNVSQTQQNFNRPGMKQQGQGQNRVGGKQQDQRQNQPLQMQPGGHSQGGNPAFLHQHQTPAQQRQDQGQNQSTLDWFRTTKAMHLQKVQQQKPLKSILKTGGKSQTKGSNPMQAGEMHPVQPGKWGQAPLAFDYLHSADPNSTLVHYEDSD